MVVVAVAHARAERLALVGKAGDERGEAGERSVGLAVGRALLEIDGAGFARRLAAAQGHVENFRDRRTGRYAGDPASAQDRGLQGELRGKAGAHLLFRARLAGLVVDDRVAAVAALFDA